ncbi:MAG: exopolysaccharide biosynthesis protein [Alphaproteobacteria bacterium]
MTLLKQSEISPTPQEEEQIHASVLLQRIITEAPPDYFTLEWLVGKLPAHSFGCILLFLALIALLPVISVVARILIIILTGQIILGYQGPVLPDRLMKRPLPTKYLFRLKCWVIPFLRRLEYIVRPRWPIMLKGTRRFTAFIAMIGMVLSLPAPIPLDIPPAVIDLLLALSFIERDGLVLFLALLSSFALLVPISIILLRPFF